MACPAFYHYDPRFRVALYGQRKLNNRALANSFKVESNKICLIKAASDHTHPGFGEVKPPKYGKFNSYEWDIYADATILIENGSCAAMFTADCCGLAVYEASQHILGFAHCGRGAMTPQNKPGEEIDNVVSRLIKTMSKKAKHTPRFTAVTTGSICPKHFTHDYPEAQKLIEPFKQFGPIAFGNEERGELNIPSIVREQLISLGVKIDNIFHDNLCTYENPLLFSYRQACHEDLDRSKRNALIVTLN